ncbi:16645_t:CDS:2 [Funneliformis mosseae]|uniref:16645_t:CDS:1 n=1 Tax=Funneliformis mosseae TaxID=27381 RepID=A0A9N9AUP4_FUNMO|nr:16645_t:CDS:2 [Funneliformis mosseae]
MKQFPIPYPEPWCLVIANTHNFAQTVDVVLLFTQSVFVEGTYRTGYSADKDFTLGTSSLTGTFDNNNKRRNIKQKNMPRERLWYVDNLSRRSFVSETYLVKEHNKGGVNGYDK